MNAVAECHVTTDTVIKGIRDYLEAQKPISHFTTLAVALHMGADEYPVRTAFSWLRRYGLIETVPCVFSVRYTKTNGEKYPAAVYQLKEKSTPADFAALHRVFCCGGSR